jgi:hypothetical protein
MTQLSNRQSPKSLESRQRKKVVFNEVVQSRSISKTHYYSNEEQMDNVDHDNFQKQHSHSQDVFISYRRCSSRFIDVLGNNSWGIACTENGLRYHYRSVENVLDPFCLQENRTTLKQIHHSVCCRDPYCSLAHCAHGKEAWNHLQADQDRSRCCTPTTVTATVTPTTTSTSSIEQCDYYHCTYLKRILLHFQGCTDRFGCPLCSVLHVNSESGKQRENEKNSEIITEGNEENQRVGTENIVSNTNMTSTTDLGTEKCIETKLKRSKETLREVKLHLVLVNHAKNCDGSNCSSANCEKMRSFLTHPQECNEVDCTLCRRVNNLLKLHCQVCSDRNCSLAVCCQKVGKRTTAAVNRKVSSTSSLGSKFDRIALNN